LDARSGGYLSIAQGCLNLIFLIVFIEGYMYTFEDDKETSSRLPQQGSADHSPPLEEVPTIPDVNQLPFAIDAASDDDSPPVHQQDEQPQSQPHDLSQQITASMHALTTPDEGATATRSPKMALAALTVACIAVFITALDQTVVVTALPQIITNLQIPITQLDHAAWIISAYLLGFVVAMPLMGRVSDIYGRRRIFQLCLIIFGIGSLFCAIAPQLGQAMNLRFLSVLQIDTSSPGLIWLIAARLFQAIGGGAIVPVSMAIASDFYGQKRRGLALGLIGAMTEAGGALGPLYGALIVASLGWQYIFYFNIPLVIILMVVAWKLIPPGKRLHEGIDWIGALLLGLMLTCLSLGLAQQGTTLGPLSPNQPTPQNNPIALVLAVVFLIAFILVERRVRWPVVDLALFKRLAFSATSLVSLLVGAALIIAMADIPIFIDTVLQGQVLDSGLALLRLTAMIPVGALLGGWLCSRITSRLTAVLGLLFTSIGFFLMSRWPLAVDWTQITISTVIAGFGFGLVIAPISTTAINAVRAQQAGMSSAIVTALRMVGMTLGLAALTSWALAYFKELAAQYPSLPPKPTAAEFTSWSLGYATHLVQSAHTVYTAVFFLSMIICLIAIIPALFLWGRTPPLSDPQMNIHEADTRPVYTGNQARWFKQHRAFSIVALVVVLALLGGGIGAAWMYSGVGTKTGTGSTGAAATATPIAGPRMIELSLDKDALTSVFASQLNAQSGLSDLKVTPEPNDKLTLALNLHIDANGLHRVMPVQVEGVISLDKQQNLQLRVTRLLRDGLDAGPTATANMQTAMNKMLADTVMPALRGQMKEVKLLSAHTSTTISCGKGATMLVLLIQAPPIQGVAAQPTPVPFCLVGPIDLNKLLPK
jgi:EmrB/QacA subfamily drug resistance transporter